MRLTDEEVKLLKRNAPVKVWRYQEPTACEIRKKYVADGEVYTVLDKRELSPSDVLRTQGKAVYQELYRQQFDHYGFIWLVVIQLGDYTDKPRFLQPSGRRSGDYTEDPNRAMRGEPEAISAQENEQYARDARAAREARMLDYGALPPARVEEELKKPGLRREERNRLRHIRHAFKRLGGRS